MPGLSDKKYPRLDIRLGREDAIRLEAEAKIRGLGESAFGRRVLEGVLRRPGAVEQALGDSSGRGSSPGLERRPAKSEDAGSSPAPPAPAEPSKEPYVPEWKQSLMTSGQRSNIGPRPKS